MLQQGILLFGKTNITDDEKKGIVEAYDFVEKFLQGNDWVAGDTLTIADFSFVTTITTWLKLAPFGPSQFPRITSWLGRMEKLPYYREGNLSGLNEYEAVIKRKLQE